MSGEGLKLDLYVRSLAGAGVHARQNAVISRLQRLEETSLVDEVAIHVWGKYVAPETATARTETGAAVRSRIDAFRSWADRTGRSIAPFFATRERLWRATDETHATLVLPTMTLAEYGAGALRFVTPCVDGDTHHTVGDRLDALEHGARHGE